jgi:hypothetical protein
VCYGHVIIELPGEPITLLQRLFEVALFSVYGLGVPSPDLLFTIHAIEPNFAFGATIF